MTSTTPIDLRAGLNINIHDRVRITVDPDVPSLEFLKTIFAPFLTNEPIGARADIAVRRSGRTIQDATHAEHEYRFDDNGVWLSDLNVQIERNDDQWTVSGTRELLTSVLPIVDLAATEAGAAMIHATSVIVDGQGVLMPAWGGVGKTSTMAKLVKNDRCSFMGDDWGFVTGDGRLLGYAKPMFIKPHHRPMYPHLFQGARKPLVPKRLSRPIGRLTTYLHPIVTQFPAVSTRVRRWSPEHKMVTPQQAFPGVEPATEAPLKLAVFVERFDGDTPEKTAQSEQWMADRLLGNFYMELPQHSRDILTALDSIGLSSLHRGLGAKGDLIAKGLLGVRCFRLRVPAEWSADQASDFIGDSLLDLVEVEHEVLM